MLLWACCVPGGWCCMQMIDAKLTDEENPNAGLIAYLIDCFCGVFGGIFNRYKLRLALEIEDSFAIDILFWCCVPCCAVTQEFMQTMERKRKNPNFKIWNINKSDRV